MRKIATLVLALLVATPTSIAWANTNKTSSHATYALGKARKCRADFVKKTEKHKVKGKEVRYVACVYVAPRVVTPAPAPTPVPTPTPAGNTGTSTPPVPSYSYKAHLDPSFVQSPSNPMAVVYTFTADATETLGATQIDTAQQGILPSGILDLYSQGTLVCSINVGGSTDGGTCAVSYTSYGTYNVVTEYFPNGVTPVTETDPETISPFSTSVAISTPLLGSTVDVNNYAYQVFTVPVTVSGLTNSLGTSGTISLTDGVGTAESCQPLVYNSSLGSASTNCTAEVKDDPNVTTGWAPSVSYSGDTNYSSSGTTASVVTVPVAPAPTVTDVTVTLQCDESGGFCTQYNPAAETTDARTNVFAGNPIYDQSPGIGTVTFTSADHLTICSAAVEPAYLGPDSAGRCTNTTEMTQFEGPITVTYTGGSVETGDTEVTAYSSATTTGGSN